MTDALSIRELTAADEAIWIAMYARLFPAETEDALAKEIARILTDPNSGGFIAMIDKEPAGFIEHALRPYANGCHSKPVPFLEGIWVDPAFRRRGIATALVARLQDYLSGLGHRELGSDVEIANAGSISFHSGLGFEETERVVYFRKAL